MFSFRFRIEKKSQAIARSVAAYRYRSNREGYFVQRLSLIVIKSKRPTSKAAGEYFSITDTNPLSTPSPPIHPQERGYVGLFVRRVCVCVFVGRGASCVGVGGGFGGANESRCGWLCAGLCAAAPAMHFLLIMSPAHHCLQQSNAYLQIMVYIVFIER